LKRDSISRVILAGGFGSAIYVSDISQQPANLSN
jgi:hypothetical protein